MSTHRFRRRAVPVPQPTDGVDTETSHTQAETEDVLLQHLPRDSALDASSSTLKGELHTSFLARNLIQGFPSRYQAYDASQPWLMYWTLQAFSIMQVGMDGPNKRKVIEKLLAMQHPEGGFGGGPGQFSHLLPTYAAVCALAIAGSPGPDGGWDQINRDKLYSFFLSLKQPDGSFIVARDSEVDVRGTYCLLVVAQLLDLLTPELVEGTAAFVASCQTYEGGFASASQPYFDLSGKLMKHPRPALGEAHGGYTFCALGAWTILQPFIASVPEAERPRIDMDRLARWLVYMQGTEAELGGFKGRTNKLVDGCYAWWVGGAFGLLDALKYGPAATSLPRAAPVAETSGKNEDDMESDDALFNREALQEYVLWAGQHQSGGLRDKPPKSVDSYHTLYCLSGLSSAQHRISPSAERRAALEAAWATSSDETKKERYGVRKTLFADALCYTEDDSAAIYVGGDANRLNATHPVFNLTMTHTEAIMAHFYRQAVPPRRPPPPV